MKETSLFSNGSTDSSARLWDAQAEIKFNRQAISFNVASQLRRRRRKPAN